LRNHAGFSARSRRHAARFDGQLVDSLSLPIYICLQESSL